MRIRLEYVSTVKFRIVPLSHSTLASCAENCNDFWRMWTKSRFYYVPNCTTQSDLWKRTVLGHWPLHRKMFNIAWTISLNEHVLAALILQQSITRAETKTKIQFLAYVNGFTKHNNTTQHNKIQHQLWEYCIKNISMMSTSESIRFRIKNVSLVTLAKCMPFRLFSHLLTHLNHGAVDITSTASLIVDLYFNIYQFWFFGCFQ